MVCTEIQKICGGNGQAWESSTWSLLLNYQDLLLEVQPLDGVAIAFFPRKFILLLNGHETNRPANQPNDLFIILNIYAHL